MQDISGQLSDLRHKIMGQPYPTPRESVMADDLLSLIEIVACINNRLDRLDKSAWRTANDVSCLANGAKPD